MLFAHIFLQMTRSLFIHILRMMMRIFLWVSVYYQGSRSLIKWLWISTILVR
jgi:hypothetical protein